MRVIPQSQVDLLEKGREGSFSLFFSRMTTWNVKGGDPEPKYQSRTDQTKNGPKPVFESSIVDLGNWGNRLVPKAGSVLRNVHARQKGILRMVRQKEGLALEVRARLTSPFVSGLGSGHPTETGMILDRNTGVPYIPASAIKGVLRLAHGLNVGESEGGEKWLRTGRLDERGRFHIDPDGDQVELDDREPSLRKYFGDVDTGSDDAVRGQLVILDAFPEMPPVLKTDIMNPHFHKYYAGENAPEDTDDPIPVKFLAVQEGTMFVFRVLAAPLGRDDSDREDKVSRTFDASDEQAVTAMFERAFSELGFGGKTSVGYGRFTTDLTVGIPGSAKASPNADAPSVLDNAESMVWENAVLTWNPGKQVLTVKHEGKTAAHAGKDVVPEKYHAKLFKKKKAVTATVKVLAEGNLFKVLAVE